MKAIFAIFAAFGALNWAALAMYGKDVVTETLGSGRKPATDAVHIVVALAAIGLVISVFRPKGKG
jgi:uncharacterized membrane protein YuzA (DUF378 family)